jgi:hypothetical protein
MTRIKSWLLYMKHMYIYDNTPLKYSQKHLFQTIFVNKTKTRHLYSIKFFLGNNAFSLTNVEQYGRDRPATNDNIVRRMRFACWITKATNAHSECVILFVFSRRQWLHEGASMLRLSVRCLCSPYADHSTSCIPRL